MEANSHLQQTIIEKYVRADDLRKNCPNERYAQCDELMLHYIIEKVDKLWSHMNPHTFGLLKSK